MRSNHKLEDFEPGQWVLYCARLEGSTRSNLDGAILPVREVNSYVWVYDSKERQGSFCEEPKYLHILPEPSQCIIGEKYYVYRSLPAYPSHLQYGSLVKVTKRTTGTPPETGVYVENPRARGEGAFRNFRYKSGVDILVPEKLWYLVEGVDIPSSEGVENEVEPGLYCSCSTPNLVESFSGIVSGVAFQYCRSCKKEKR